MIVEPEVVGEFASGSHEAFHKIFKLFYPKVYAFIRGFIKDLDDSEDLTQIVFIKLWNKRAIFTRYIILILICSCLPNIPFLIISQLKKSLGLQAKIMFPRFLMNILLMIN